MSYFDDASLVMIPSGYKTSKVYSVKPTDGSGDLTFSRSNDTATRVNSAGLIEKVRTNLVSYSEQFDNAFWVKSNTTVVANSSIAPNGTTTAELVYPTTTGSNRLLEKSFSISASTPYTGTWYLKASGLNWVAVDHIDGNVGAWFNLSTGTIGTISSGTTASIESVGNGWYRCRVSKTSGGTTGYHDIRLVDGDNVTSVTANGTNGVLVWGAQLEAGDIATAYIATTSSAVSVGPVANVPRLDYLGSSCPRLLLEPQRTNIITFSEQMNNATWLTTNATITSNATTSPDGYTNADLLNVSATGLSLYNGFGATANQTHTASIFVKAGTMTTLTFGLSDNLVDEGSASYNLSTLTTSVIGSASWTNQSASIVDYGNGWYRLIYTGTNTSGSVSFIEFIRGSVGTLYVWGAQNEIASYATSYIPTLGAAVTRGADAASKTGISSLIGQSEGTLYWEGYVTPMGDYNSLMSVEAIGTRFFNLRLKPNNKIEAATSGFSPDILMESSFAATAGTYYKIAACYKSGDSVLYVNGQQVDTESQTFTNGALTEFRVNVFNVFDEQKSTGQALLFKTRLSNADLAALTTI